MNFLKSLKQDKNRDGFGIYNPLFFKMCPTIAYCPNANYIQYYVGDYITPT